MRVPVRLLLGGRVRILKKLVVVLRLVLDEGGLLLKRI